ncbi:MAG: SDR family oxidoreductase [Gemmatimonadetes bacterium]|nr:SDR family oxidoreductase [Gemmatimonadota bacterium]
MADLSPGAVPGYAPDAFAGAVVFITGGASGIGAACARAFAAAGARVAVGDLRAEGTAAVAREVNGMALPCDVRDDAAVEAAVAAVVARHGRLDVAVNAAGVGGLEVKTAEYPPASWDAVVDVNLTGVFRCLRNEIPAMLAGGGGAIVNVASVAGLAGFPRHPAYAAAKHGVVGLTRSAALEYVRQGLRINALCPGFTWTPMVEGMVANGTPRDALERGIPARRLGTVEEMASVVLALCAPSNAFLVGQAIAVDGGMTAG